MTAAALYLVIAMLKIVEIVGFVVSKCLLL